MMQKRENVTCSQEYLSSYYLGTDGLSQVPTTPHQPSSFELHYLSLGRVFQMYVT